MEAGCRRSEVVAINSSGSISRGFKYSWKHETLGKFSFATSDLGAGNLDAVQGNEAVAVHELH